MKKQLKYIVPFALLFFILPLTVSAAPVQSWGISVGDEVLMTAGWAIDVKLDDDTWDMLDTYAAMIDPAFSAREAYNDFQTLDSVFNFKFDITHIDEDVYDYGFGPYSYDVIAADVSMKAAKQPNYGLPDALALYELNANAALFDKYATLFDVLQYVNSTYLISELTAHPMPADLLDNMTVQRWYNSHDGVATNMPSGTPIFIPLTWDFSEKYDELVEMADTADLYTQVSAMFGITVANWDQLVAAFGFTKVVVKPREITVQFQFSSMNEDILDTAIVQMGLENPFTLDPFNDFDDVLTFLNLTDFDMEFDFHLEYTNNGILNNFHYGYEVGGKYEGDAFKIAPQVDVSRGEHNRINTKYTIPGFPVYLVIIAAVGTVSILLIRIKKRK